MLLLSQSSNFCTSNNRVFSAETLVMFQHSFLQITYNFIQVTVFCDKKKCRIILHKFGLLFAQFCSYTSLIRKRGISCDVMISVVDERRTDSFSLIYCAY